MNRLSVITVNLNNVEGLSKTTQSLFNQSFTDFEIIIIDGGSADGSVDLLRKYSDRIVYWVSETDNGIYHAMNKGIKAATGEYCLFLNSGDWLAETTTLESVFAQNPQADIVAGDVYFYDTHQNAIKWNVLSPDQFTAKTLFLGTLPHQATFIRRSLFERVGLYNEQLKIASDWLFFVDALLVHHCSYEHFPGTIAYFNMDGISCNPATNELPKQEQRSILQARYPLFLDDYDRLNEREKERQRWLSSREYAVYQAFTRYGIIKSGVFLRRVKRVIGRTLARLW